MKWTSLFLTLVVGSWCFPSDAAESVIVGVLEEPQCKNGAPRAVRPLFAKQGAEWVALTSQAVSADFDLEKVEWTAAFDGKDVGHLRSSGPKGIILPEWTYPRDYLHILEAGQPLPEIRNKTRGFAGWCDAPQHRPVVVVSAPNFKDPERWKRVAPSNADKDQLFRSFRDVTKDNELCRVSESGGPTPYKYGPADMKVETTYQNAQGQHLVAVTLRNEYAECQSELGWPESPKWFFMGANTTYLGSDLMLVDAGDYDGHGGSEVVFWYSGYNRDGYVLFSNGFKNRADFIWSYH